MTQQDRRKTIPWIGLGLILGSAIGSFLGLHFANKYFAIFCGGGAGIGLIVGAMIDNLLTNGKSIDE